MCLGFERIMILLKPWSGGPLDWRSGVLPTVPLRLCPQNIKYSPSSRLAQERKSDTLFLSVIDRSSCTRRDVRF